MTTLRNFNYIDDFTATSADIEARYTTYLEKFANDLPAVNENMDNLAEEAIRISALRLDYGKLLWEEENNLTIVETSHKLINKIVRKYYNKKLSHEDATEYGLPDRLTNDDFDLLVTKSGVEDLVQSNDLYRAITTTLGKQTRLVRVIKDQIDSLVQRSMNIGTAAKTKRHNDGAY